MIDLDNTLAGAARRLHTQTDHLPIPEMPHTPSTRRMAPVRIGGALLLAGLTAGVVVMVQREPESNIDSGTLPAGVLDGSYGTELTLTEVDDGDNNPRTIKLRSTPLGGEATVKPFSEASMPTVEVGTADSSVIGVGDLCIDATGAGGVCGPIDSAEMTLGPRGPEGQAMVYGLPPEVTIVTFTSGDQRFWQRPRHGVAIFPFGERAVPNATVQFIAGDESVLDTQTARNDSMTQAEVTAAVVTRPTAATIDKGYFVPLGDDEISGGEYVRHHGRTVLTGFDGPFAIGTTFPERADDGTTSGELTVISVLDEDLAGLVDRLAEVPRGSIRRTISKPDGVHVIAWTNDALSDSVIDRELLKLELRDVQPGRGRAFDDATAWNSENSPPMGDPWRPSPLGQLYADYIKLPGNRLLAAQADDVGQFMVGMTEDFPNFVLVGGPATPPAVPVVDGPVLAEWLHPVPPNVTAVTITLYDGTVLRPEVIDVTRYVPAKLLWLGKGTPTGTIKSVEVTRA